MDNVTHIEDMTDRQAERFAHATLSRAIAHLGRDTSNPSLHAISVLLQARKAVCNV